MKTPTPENPGLWNYRRIEAALGVLFFLGLVGINVLVRL
jgi:hypothetical protein